MPVPWLSNFSSIAQHVEQIEYLCSCRDMQICLRGKDKVTGEVVLTLNQSSIRADGDVFLGLQMIESDYCM